MMGQRCRRSPWYQLVEGGGTYRSPDISTDHPRRIGPSVRDYPIVVDVTISEDAALANWRR